MANNNSKKQYYVNDITGCIYRVSAWPQNDWYFLEVVTKHWLRCKDHPEYQLITKIPYKMLKNYVLLPTTMRVPNK